MAASHPTPAEAVPPPEDAAAAVATAEEEEEEEDEWDADGFVIPNLSTQEDDVIEHSVPKSKDPEPIHEKEEKIYLGPYGAPPSQAKQQEPIHEKEEKIYLGPYGAPPSQAKQQELNTVGRKQRFRNRLKEADSKFTGSAQENKVETLQELMGARTDSKGMQKSSARDWLDPHCHESEFDRKPY